MVASKEVTYWKSNHKLLICSGFSLHFQNTGNDLLWMQNVALTFVDIHCFPKSLDTFYKFILCIWIYYVANIFLQLMPEISIGFISGHSAGVFDQFIAWSANHCCARLDVCLGSLSCWNRCPSGNVVFKKGRRVCSKIFMYRAAFMIPLKMAIPVVPHLLIPA